MSSMKQRDAASIKYVQQRFKQQENEDLYIFNEDKPYLIEVKQSPEPTRKNYFKFKKNTQIINTESEYMPSGVESDMSLKMLHIEGAERTISSDSPFKKNDDIEAEINELKKIKTRMQNETKDQKWEKIPKIF